MSCRRCPAARPRSARCIFDKARSLAPLLLLFLALLRAPVWVAGSRPGHDRHEHLGMDHSPIPGVNAASSLVASSSSSSSSFSISSDSAATPTLFASVTKEGQLPSGSSLSSSSPSSSSSSFAVIDAVSSSSTASSSSSSSSSSSGSVGSRGLVVAATDGANAAPSSSDAKLPRQHPRVRQSVSLVHGDSQETKQQQQQQQQQQQLQFELQSPTLADLDRDARRSPSSMLERSGGKCSAPAEYQPDRPIGYFRIPSAAVLRTYAGDSFELYSNEDCSGEPEDVEVSIVPVVVDKSDVFSKSYGTISLSKAFPGTSMYVCMVWARDLGQGEVDKSCLTKVEWPAHMRSPSAILDHFWKNHQQLFPYVQKAQDVEDVTLMVIEWLFAFAGICFIVSVVHSIMLSSTMKKSQPPVPFEGLHASIGGSTIISVLHMFLFVVGVNCIVAPPMELCYTNVSQHVVKAQFFAGLLLGVLGLFWIFDVLCLTQLVEVSLLSGKSVGLDPKPRLSSTVRTGFMGFSLLICLGGILLASLYRDRSSWQLGGSVSGFLGVVKVLQHLIELQGRHRHGLCSVEICALQASAARDTGPSPSIYPHEGPLAGRDAFSEKDEEVRKRNLLRYLQTHGEARIPLSKLCAAQRSGRDPFAAPQESELAEVASGSGEAAAAASGEAPTAAAAAAADSSPSSSSSPSDFHFLDLLWLPRFVFQKSGSKVALINAPFFFLAMLMLLSQFAEVRLSFLLWAPGLEEFQPAQGILVPAFHPNIKEYKLFHDTTTSHFSFFTKPDEQTSRWKEFNFSGFVKGKKASDLMLTVDGTGRESPYQLQVKVRDGANSSTFGREQTYHVTFAAIRRLLVSVLIRTEGWSKCMFWGSFRDKTIATPKNRRLFDIEIFTTAYATFIPISEEQWENRKKEPQNSIDLLTSVLFFRPNDTFEACTLRCDRNKHCMEAQLTSLGCQLTLLETSEESCFALHSSALAKARNEMIQGSNLPMSRRKTSAVETLTTRDKVTGFLCPTKDRAGGHVERYTQCDYVSEPSNNGFLLFQEVELTSPHLNSLSLAVERQRRGTSDPPTTSKHWLSIWHGPPMPDTLFIAGSPGIKTIVEKRSNEERLVLRLQRYKVTKEKIKLLIILPIEDEGYRPILHLDKDHTMTRWDGSKEGLDFSACDQGGLMPLWVCQGPEKIKETLSGSSSDMSAVVIELDRLYPNVPHIKGEVQAMEPEVGSVGVVSNHFEISILTESGMAPAAWALEDSCFLDASAWASDQLPLLLSEDTFLRGLDCEATTLRLQEGEVGETKDVVLAPHQFLALSVRLYQDADSRSYLLQGALSKDPSFVRNMFKSEPGGILIKNSLHDFCITHVNMMASVLIPWLDLLGYFKTPALMKTMLCDAGKEYVPPSIFSISMRLKRLSPSILAEVIDCSSMTRKPLDPFLADLGIMARPGWDGPYLQWFSSSSSPVAAAIELGYLEVLRALLKRYPDTVTDFILVVSLVDNVVVRVQHSVLELAILNGCERCIPIIHEAMEEAKRWCHAGVRLKTPTSEEESPTFDCDAFERRSQNLNLRHSRAKFEKDFTGFTAALKLAIERLSPDEIEELDLSDNKLGDERFALLAPTITRLGRLVSLKVAGNDLDACPPTATDLAQAGPLLSTIAKLPSLKSLSIAENRLCSTGIRVLTGLVTEMPVLRDMNVSMTRLENASITELQNFVLALRHLEVFDVSFNHLGLKSLMAMLPPPPIAKKLKEFFLKKVDIRIKSGDELTELSEKMSEMRQLIKLDISGNAIRNEEGMALLGRAVREMTQLRELYMNAMLLSGPMLLSFAQSMGQQSLEVLSLRSNNNLGPTVFETVAEYFLGTHLGQGAPTLKPRRLKSLDTSRNLMNKAGAEKFVELTKKYKYLFKSMTSLEMAQTGLRGEDIALVMRAVINYEGLERLSFAGNWVSSKVDALQDLSAMRAVRELDFSHCQTKWSYIQDVVMTQSGPPHLEELYLQGSLKTDHVVDLHFLTELENLRILGLGDNAFPRAVVRSLLSALSSLPSLTELDIRGSTFWIEDFASVVPPGSFAQLAVLRGDFTPCTMEALRAALPHTAISNTKDERTRQALLQRLLQH